MTSASMIPEPQLTELRRAARARASAAGRFVDPQVMYQCKRILRRHPESWASAVLGRNLVRRSMIDPSLPWLNNGDAEILLAADFVEDEVALAGIDSAR